MSFVSDGRGCCNNNCPVMLQSKCERSVPIVGGGVMWTPKRNKHGGYWCDGFSDKKEVK